MPSFADSIFLFILALLLFGPKKLPVLARELGKWMGEFRRASNEFKMQMEDELRASEQADRQKQIAAMEAAAPIPPPLGEPAEPEHPHTRYNTPDLVAEPSLLAPEPNLLAQETANGLPESSVPLEGRHPERSEGSPYFADVATTSELPAQPPTLTQQTADGVRPIPIATSGSLNMMPPATGLPTPRNSRPNALSSLVDSIPEAPANGTHPGTTEPETESLTHGD